MSDYFLDLKDKPRVVDFLVETAAYADDAAREVAAKWAKQYQDGEHVPTDKLAAAAKKLAEATWPARYAVKIFCTKENPAEEWTRVNAAIRDSTAHLLKRLKTASKAKTLDAVLADPDAGIALRDEEQLEIAEVRRHVAHDIWKEKAKVLDVLVKAGEKELAGYDKRFTRLRELGTTLPSSMLNEVFSKLSHYEDRILFAGEVIPLEILDEEIQYYHEQKEVSPLEE
ncbi:MAG: hypothetical protein ABIO72_02855 [Patescibacteria group bacterium]